MVSFFVIKKYDEFLDMFYIVMRWIFGVILIVVVGILSVGWFIFWFFGLEFI